MLKPISKLPSQLQHEGTSNTNVCRTIPQHMTNTLTLCINKHSFLPSLPLCLPNSSLSPCVPDLNLNNNLVPASPTPRRYFLNSTILPKVLYNDSLTLLLRPSSNLPDSLSSIPSPATPKKLLSEQLPFRMSSSHSALSRPSEENKVDNLTPILPLPTSTWLHIPLLHKKLP